MTSAFIYYGTTEEVLTYLKNKLDNQYHTMIDQMSPEWRNAVVYVLSRSKSQIYLNAMYNGYESGILNRVDPALVLYGTNEFSTKIEELTSE